MKYNNLDDIFYLEDLFIVWQAEQAKEKEYKNDKVDIRSFSRDGFVDEKMWVSSFLNEKRVLYIGAISGEASAKVSALSYGGNPDTWLMQLCS